MYPPYCADIVVIFCPFDWTSEVVMCKSRNLESGIRIHIDFPNMDSYFKGLNLNPDPVKKALNLDLG